MINKSIGTIPLKGRKIDIYLYSFLLKAASYIHVHGVKKKLTHFPCKIMVGKMYSYMMLHKIHVVCAIGLGVF